MIGPRAGRRRRRALELALLVAIVVAYALVVTRGSIVSHIGATSWHGQAGSGVERSLETASPGEVS